MIDLTRSQDILRRLHSLYAEYLSQVRTLAKEVERQAVIPFLKQRGWRLEVEYDSYALIDNKGAVILCSSLQDTSYATDKKVIHICSLLEVYEIGMAIPLGVFMKQ